MPEQGNPGVLSAGLSEIRVLSGVLLSVLPGGFPCGEQEEHPRELQLLLSDARVLRQGSDEAKPFRIQSW